MANSTRTLPAASLLSPPIASSHLGHDQANAEIALKKYNDAIYKWTQQLLSHTRAEADHQSSTLSSASSGSFAKPNTYEISLDSPPSTIHHE